MGRTHARKEFDDGVRVTLLESDADEFEMKVVGLQKSMQRVTQSLVATAITLATSSILMALNLVVMK